MIVRISEDDEPIEAPPGRDPWGLNARDEVWDGVYRIMPIGDVEHQQIIGRLTTVFGIVIDLPGLGDVFPGNNISDRDHGWTKNYRIPDVCVFLRGTTARNLGTHWQGGPDFAVEVLSEDDHAREKIPFYSANGVQELLIVDRDPWALEFHRFLDGSLSLVGTSTIDRPDPLVSSLLPLDFRLLPGDSRPKIEIRHRDGHSSWKV